MSRYEELVAWGTYRGETVGDQAPILAAVGQLQYEVVSARMTGEFSVPVRLEPLPYHLALATDEAGAEALRRFPITCEVVTRVSDKARLALFRNRWQADALRRERPDIRLNRLIAADD